MIKKIFEFNDILFKEDDIKDLVSIVKKYDKNDSAIITYENPNKEFIEVKLKDIDVYKHLDFTKLISISIMLSSYIHDNGFMIKIENNSNNSYIEISSVKEDDYNVIKKDIIKYLEERKRQNWIQRFDPSNLFFAITKVIGNTLLYFSVFSFILIILMAFVYKNISNTVLLIFVCLMIIPALFVTELVQRANNKIHFVNSKVVEKRKKAWMFVLIHILIPAVVTLAVSIAIVKLL